VPEPAATEPSKAPPWGCRPAAVLTAAARACAPGGGPVVLFSPAPTCLPELVDFVKLRARCCPARPVLGGRACAAVQPGWVAKRVHASPCCWDWATT